MSTLTTIFGMLPLVPGAGTELYRGLGAVIVGGMAVSTRFTLILLPSLLRLVKANSSPLANQSFLVACKNNKAPPCKSRVFVIRLARIGVG